MGRDKPFEDGGGLCSPGRWPRRYRTRPRGFNDKLFTKSKEIFKKAVADASGGADDELGFMLKLAAGRIKENPF